MSETYTPYTLIPPYTPYTDLRINQLKDFPI